MSLKQINQFLKSGKQEEHKGIGEAVDGFDQTEADSSTTTTMEASTVVDSNTALKNFLNSIPISSIPNIQNKNLHVVQLKIDDTLKDAIKIMLQDAISSSSHDAAIATKKATNRYIAFLSFPTMALWCLEALEKNGCLNGKGNHVQKNGFFCLLEQNPFIGKTKIRELAKSFLWDPFFPVNLEDDTLIRALLLFSKHRIHVLPVTDKTSTEITGFITQNALLELLLQSSGLEWFDGIGNTPFSEFRFNNEEHCPHVYSDQSVWDALRALWKNKASVVAIVKRGSEELVGSFRSFDIYLLLDNDELFNSIRTKHKEGYSLLAFLYEVQINFELSCMNTTMSEFLQLDSARKQNPHGFMSAGDLCLRNNCLATMASPVTLAMTHTLEQAMKTMVEARTETIFLIESGSNQMVWALTSRNIIMEFAPSGIDTRLRGGGFFETALEQTGCHLERGTLLRDH